MGGKILNITHMTKRDKKGRFTKVRKWLRNIKIAVITIMLYKYFEPALQIIWDQQAQPYLAQLIQ